MDKSSRTDIAPQEQRAAWNEWNAAYREQARDVVSNRQAQVIQDWLTARAVNDAELIDVGCGAGWMCERLLRFGRVTGTDWADEVVERARQRLPEVNFIVGDFFALSIPSGRFDVAVSLEVLSHVADQPAFIARIADLLRPGGLLMLATQNRPVLERWTAIGGPTPGQLRRWVDAPKLRSLLGASFDIIELTSIHPVGDQGLLRLVNSRKINRALALVCGQQRIDRVKERCLLGHTLMVLARKRAR